MEKHRYQQDNRGMTLVELLVAIVLLAIVVVPLLHVFITAAKTNLKARERLRITTAAQDIMEGLKADSIAELAYQFDYPEVSHAANPNIKAANEFHLIRKSLINGGSGGIQEVRAVIDETTREVTSITPVNAAETDENKVPSVHSVDGGVTYEFVEKPDGKYYFTLENVTLQNASFDALIEVDATPYRAGGSVSADTARHNEKEIINISTMDTRYDAFYVQTADMVTTVLQEMNATYTPATPVKAEDLKMEITMKVSNTVAPTGINMTKAAINYTFSTGGTTPYVVSKDYDFFSNYATGAELRNVYLFYFPLYGGIAPDKITYENQDGVPTTLHVIKQEPVDTTNLAYKETNYHCDFTIKEIGDRVDPLTKFRTNLDTNLFDAYTAGVAPTPLNGIRYYLNSTLLSNANFNVDTLSGEETVDRIFDVTIDLYEAGSLGGGFPLEDKLTTLTGSKN